MHNSSKFRLKLKGYDKKWEMMSDNQGTASPLNRNSNADSKMEYSMIKFGEVLLNLSQKIQTLTDNLNKFEDVVATTNDKLEALSLSCLQKKHSQKIIANQTVITAKASEKAVQEDPTPQTQNDQFDESERVKGEGDKTDNVPFEERFKLIAVQVPQIGGKNSETRKDDILKWLSSTCKTIFSGTFKILISGNLNTRSSKTYCSQNLLYYLIQFIKKNDLTVAQIKSINDFMKSTLLPYFQLKYPQSELNQVNLRLANKLEKIDDYQNNNNDLVYQSDTTFAWSEKGQYNYEIMQVLNYIINLPNDPVALEKNQELIQKEEQLMKLKEKMCKQSGEQANKQKEKKEQNGEIDLDEQQINLYNAFQSDMEKLFKGLEDEEEVFRMKKGYSPKQLVLKHPKLVLSQKDPAKKQLYKQKVKEYTKFLIGRKVSESVDEYSFVQLREGNLFIKNSQILRILNKWCTHLRQKFLNVHQIIENREEPFRMFDGSQGYLSKTQRIILRKLMEREEKNIVNYLDTMLENNYEFQEKNAKKQLAKEFEWYSKEQSTVGMFTSTLFYNNENYIIGYLNKLIDSLLKVSKDFNEVISLEGSKRQIEKEFEKKVFKLCIEKIDINKFMHFVYQTNCSRKVIFNSQSVPQFVSFRIGDLLRCKCSSKQSEITALYKEIMRISDTNSKLMKIIRIKNRLSLGTRDILINLLYRNKILIQIQLQIDQAKSHFITCSSSFKHYLYELGRAEFGPISEMSSIWMNHDYRSQWYKTRHNQLNVRKKIPETHQCFDNISEQDIGEGTVIYSIQTFPFECDYCGKLWTDSHFVETHTHCNICHKNVCGYCEIDMDIKITEQSFKAALKGIISEQKEFRNLQISNINEIPDFGASMKLYAKDLTVKQFRKVFYEYKTYLFEVSHDENEEQVYELMKDITTNEDKEIFLEQNQVITLDHQIYERYRGATLEEKKNNKNADNIDIAKDYFLPKRFQLILNQKRSSVLEEGKRISDNRLSKIEACPDVKKLNLSENRISDFELIMEKFPGLQIAVLTKNFFKTLPPSIKTIANSLTFLYLNNNEIKQLPQQVCKLSRLKYLNLAHNDLERLPDDFKELIELKTLLLGYNRLEYFKSLPLDLQMLDLQHNHFKETLDITELNKLLNLNLAFNKLNYLKGLSGTQSLKMLDLSHNQLTDQKFKNLYSLENLNISFNKIQIIYINYENIEESKLRILNISNNKITKIHQKCYKNMCKVQNLCLADNPIESISNGIFHMRLLEELNISRIRTVEIKKKRGYRQENNIQEINKKQTQGQELNHQTDSDDDQKTTDILPNNTHLYLTKLQSLDLSNNKLHEIPEVLSKMVNLNELDISSNYIKSIDNIMMLQSLDIRNNKLRHFNEKNAENVKSLKTLKLKGNKKLAPVDTTMVKKVIKNLQIFDLSEKIGSESSIDSDNTKTAGGSKKSIGSCQDGTSSEESHESIENRILSDFDNPNNQQCQIEKKKKINNPLLSFKKPTQGRKNSVRQMEVIDETIVEDDKQNMEYEDQQFE